MVTSLPERPFVALKTNKGLFGTTFEIPYITVSLVVNNRVMVHPADFSSRIGRMFFKCGAQNKRCGALCVQMPKYQYYRKIVINKKSRAGPLRNWKN